MALIKCSNCNADVSDKAITCPKCNKPMNNQRRAAMKGILLSIMIFALCGGVWIYENYFEFGSVDGSYEIKEFSSEKKDKIGIFVRADKVSNLSFLMIDLSDMRFYWADMYIGKAEIE